MPAQGRHSFYDITPLEPLIEAGFTLLTPNYRLARRIRSEWDEVRAAAGARAWEPLPAEPLEAWLLGQWRRAVATQLLPPRVLLAAGQSQEIWQQVIEEEQHRAGQYHLLQPAAAAAQAAEAREMALRWRLDLGARATRQEFDLAEDCACRLRWCDRITSRLEEAGLATPTDAIAMLPGCAGQLPPAKVALLEVDDLPPLFMACLDALCEKIEVVGPQGAPARCALAAFDDRRAELAAAARWAHRVSREDAGITVGIVLQDTGTDRGALEYLLRREFGCLGEAYGSLPVNFSTGITLDRAPVVRDALRILRLGLHSVPLKEVVALLQTRFAMLPDAQSSLATLFLARLHEDMREAIPLADLRHAASQTELDGIRGLSLGRYLMAMFTLRELQRPASPSSWIERFTDVLDLWGWPGPGPLDSLEYQQVERWYETLEEFAGYDAIHPSLRLEAALQLLERCLARQVSQPQSADSNVQVLGPLEAAGLAFDHLWLCGMQGSSWPAPPRPNPFIPAALQRRLQMPHASAEREWAFADGLMQQYRRSTNELIASYARQLDGIPDTASALLEGFEPCDSVEWTSAGSPWLEQWRARELEPMPDGAAPPVDEAELASLRGGSGLLEDQSHCPFRAFARRRLQVEALPEASVGLSSAERGSLLHSALYILWGELGDSSALAALQPAAGQRLVSDAVEGALQTLPARRRAGQLAFIELERQRLQELLGEWLAVERSRVEAFTVYRREEGIQLVLDRLEVSLRVDRIDQLQDGSLVVIDYKSGQGSVSDWLGERPAKPQLLLYGSAAPAPPAAIAFARVRPRACAYVGLGRTEAAPGISTDIGKSVRNRSGARDWQSLNDEWCAHLERLAREFLAGEARVDPLSAASCAWCNLHPLCRVGHTSGAEPAA